MKKRQEEEWSPFQFFGPQPLSDRESDEKRHRDESDDSNPGLRATTELIHMLDRLDRAEPKNFAPIRKQDIEKNRQQDTKPSKPEQPVLRFVLGSVSAGGGPKSEREDDDGRDAEETRHICFRPFRTRARRWRILKIKIKQDPTGVPTAHGPQHQGYKEKHHPKLVPLAAASQPFAYRAQNLDALRDAGKHKKTDDRDNNAEAARFQLVIKVADFPPQPLKPSARVHDKIRSVSQLSQIRRTEQ